MSSEILGGIDYSAIKRFFNNLDHVQLSFAGPFANVEQSYVVGTSAYLANTTLPTTKLGWTIITPTAPLPLFYQAAGLTQGPTFETKDTLFYATADCTISFDSPTNLPIPIPATTYMRFHTKSFVFYATQASGTLDVWVEG